MRADWHGGRAKCLQRLIRLDMPVPTTVALGFDTVRGIAEGTMPDLAAILSVFDGAPLLSVRPSSEHADWGGPGAILNIGMSDARVDAMAPTVGEEAAIALYLRFIQAYAIHVARLDADAFPLPDVMDRAAMARALEAYEAEAEEPFPQDQADQLQAVLRAMARAWEGTTARLLRQAQGAPADAGLGLVVQAMALGVGHGESGSGVIQFVDADTGAPQITGRYLAQSQGREALTAKGGALYLTKDARGASLEDCAPEVFSALLGFGDLARKRLREEMQIEFTIEDGELAILDAVRLSRSARASVRIAVDLAEDGVIDRAEAVQRIEPRALSELLHRQIAPGVSRDVITRGIGASPGAAAGRIVFSSQDAQASHARGEPCILVRRETGPEDIRGMHAASGVLTERGGITSHAAVIGRGLGLPCVVGASELSVDD
ncbi:MAG: PEP-utilizing enzyme, partial [Pseudomonadota bacterium]